MKKVIVLQISATTLLDKGATVEAIGAPIIASKIVDLANLAAMGSQQETYFQLIWSEEIGRQLYATIKEKTPELQKP